MAMIVEVVHRLGVERESSKKGLPAPCASGRVFVFQRGETGRDYNHKDVGDSLRDPYIFTSSFS